MRFALALILGALGPLSLAPFGLWPAGAVSVAGWFYLLYRSPRRAWLLGWLYGVGKYAVGVSWVYVSIHQYGNAPPLLAGFLVVLFVSGLALFPLLNAWVFALLRRGRPLGDGLLFVALLVAFEWLLTWLLTGFPWLYVGYAHLDTPLANLAPVGGVLLVSFALALSAVMAISAVLCSNRAGRALAMALALSPWLLGWLAARPAWVASGEPLQVALVQGNIDQALKWQPETRLLIYRTYLRLSEPHWDVDLLIWPEAALTFLGQEAAVALELLDGRGRQTDTALVLGVPEVEWGPSGDVVFRNTAVAVGTGEGRYVKRRLVPFGEYVPLEGLLRGLIDFFDLPMSRSEPGAWRQPLLDIGGHLAAMAICYEVVYPELVREQARRADVLLTISNDSWFGRSIGPLQHLEMARMRALETGRWMLRGTNNGVTAVIDHQGRMLASLPQFEPGVLRAQVHLMSGETPFLRFGHTPLLLLLAVLLASLSYLRFRSGGPR